MQKIKITERDEVLLDALKYKKIGNELNKLELHLGAANKSLKIIKSACCEIEKETGRKMRFIFD